MEKYRDLMFLDLDGNKTFKVWGGNLEFHRGSQKRGIKKVGGWFVFMRMVKRKGGYLRKMSLS